MDTFLTKEQGRRIAEIIGDAKGCGAIWNVIMGDLDNPYCDGFVIGGQNKAQTKLQEMNQCDGPHRPTVEHLALAMLRAMPGYLEISAISIKGQGGGIFIECYHDGADMLYEFDSSCRRVDRLIESGVQTPPRKGSSELPRK